MTASYDPNLATDLDLVRFLLSDTKVTAAYFSDEEIEAMVTLQGGAYPAAAAIAETLATKLGAIPDISVDGYSTKYQQVATRYKELAASLRAQLASPAGPVSGGPLLGGVSISEMKAVDQESDRPKDAFYLGMMSIEPGGMVMDNDEDIA